MISIRKDGGYEVDIIHLFTVLLLTNKFKIITAVIIVKNSKSVSLKDFNFRKNQIRRLTMENVLKRYSRTFIIALFVLMIASPASYAAGLSDINNSKFLGLYYEDFESFAAPCDLIGTKWNSGSGTPQNVVIDETAPSPNQCGSFVDSSVVVWSPRNEADRWTISSEDETVVFEFSFKQVASNSSSITIGFGINGAGPKVWVKNDGVYIYTTSGYVKADSSAFPAVGQWARFALIIDVATSTAKAYFVDGNGDYIAAGNGEEYNISDITAYDGVIFYMPYVPDEGQPIYLDNIEVKVSDERLTNLFNGEVSEVLWDDFESFDAPCDLDNANWAKAGTVYQSVIIDETAPSPNQCATFERGKAAAFSPRQTADFFVLGEDDETVILEFSYKMVDSLTSYIQVGFGNNAAGPKLYIVDTGPRIYTTDKGYVATNSTIPHQLGEWMRIAMVIDVQSSTAQVYNVREDGTYFIANGGEVFNIVDIRNYDGRVFIIPNPPEGGTPVRIDDLSVKFLSPEFISADLTRDGIVDFLDFALLAEQWLVCSDPEGCN